MTIPYGSWPSPLSAASVSAASPRFEGAQFVGDDVWWAESIAAEGGRTAVRRRTASGDVETLLPAPWNARSRVHEYGGGAWTAVGDALVFVEKTDQRVWILRPGSEPIPATSADPTARYGGLRRGEGFVLAVRERDIGTAVPARDIVRIPLDGGATTSLVAGSDFVAQPSLSPDGTRLAWIAWNHPAMPWDASELRVGTIEDGKVTAWPTRAGGSTSPVQPIWLDDETIVFSDDPTDRWNLYRLRLGEENPLAIAPSDADTGGGLWVLGARWFDVLADGRIVALRTNGADETVVIDPASGAVTPLNTPLSTGGVVEDAVGTRVLLSGSTRVDGPGLWSVDIDTGDVTTVSGASAPWGAQWMPQPRAVRFDGPSGPIEAFDYPPTNPLCAAPVGEKPPYVVFVHGGPTAHVGPAASGKIAYLTSRGIGVLDVNYGGSTGYGRRYRERLRGAWGIIDVDDVAAAARGLAASGTADPERIAIAGGSAGGWTVLGAVTRTDAFAAGISRYGVGDARALAADTHDFEARYLDGLIGPFPEAEAVYLQRSPLTRPDLFRVPLLLLQGAEDAVVPPAQSEAVRDALARQGVPHAYVLYEGEGHGFRRAETVVNALETELAFLAAVFEFSPPDVAPLELD
ncbi:prolyl oligopeptidase family serine peptidase [Microbacterium sp. SLBN-146]|uniref:S9 family peptidase n=1 Tax=Microbacterium sp. SLBN-146 TaxID=2768457 RepID=UPI001C92FA78|nr:prolyl oligopeptidase family serine peptidase [Microbacterium sp. SLBN-146]